MSTPLIFLDTNALFAGDEGPHLVSPKAIADLKSLRTLGIYEYVVSHITYLELVEQGYRRATEIRDKAAKNLKHLNSFFPYKHSPLPSDVKLRSQIEKATAAKLRDASIIVAKLPIRKIRIDQIALNAVRKVPPFENKPGTDKGFKDALIVETFKHVCSSHKSAPIHLVCEDVLAHTACISSVPTRDVQLFAKVADLKAHLTLAHEKKTKTAIANIITSAPKVFYDEDDQTCVFTKFKVREVLQKEFKSVLENTADTPSIRSTYIRINAYANPSAPPTWRIPPELAISTTLTAFDTVKDGLYFWKSYVDTFQLLISDVGSTSIVTKHLFKNEQFQVNWCVDADGEGNLYDAEFVSLNHLRTRYGELPFTSSYRMMHEGQSVQQTLEHVATTPKSLLWPKASNEFRFPDSVITLIR